MKMAAALFLVLAIIFIGVAVLKRFNLTARLQGGGGRMLQIEERLALGPRKQLVVVRFLNKVLVLGVSDNAINVIAEHQNEHVSQPDFQQALERESAEDSPS